MDMGGEEIWTEFARTIGNYQRSGTAREMARMVAGIKGFSSFQKMMDLGGGSGICAIALLAEHPTMTGVVFDQPAVVKEAESFIAQYEVQDRLSVMGGDYTSDSLGEGYDLIWASATLNFSRNDLPRMMTKIFEALNPGGVFISLADGVTHERTRPALYVLESLNHALNGLDMMFDKGEIAEAMRGAGFVEVESRTVPTPMMAMEMDIARKGG
jgi:predicted TPR repeat methyltransferase